MSDHIDMYFRYTVTPGQEDRFQAYLDKVFPLTAQEPYILEYEIFRAGDGTYLQHERYENEAAIAKHMEFTADGQADFAAATELVELRGVGPLSESFRTGYAMTDANVYERFRHVAR